MSDHGGALWLVALLSASLLACDRPGEEEQKAEGRASMQAEQAQAKADQKIAAARIDFEKARDNYRAARESDLADLNKRITDLDAKEKTAVGRAKADLDERLPLVRAQRDAFVAHLRNLDTTAPATWDAARDRLDQEWSALKTSVDKL